jgi:hypothetical protein
MSDLPTNPFAPPASNIDVTAAGATAEGAFSGRLFSPRQMGVAAFLGSALAGVLLLQANYRVMGKRAQANKAIIVGLLAAGLQMGVAMALPDGVPATPFNIAAVFAFYKIAQSLQGKSFLAHVGAGGPRASNWWVAGAVLACVVLVFLGVVAWQFAHSVPSPSAS